MILELLNKVCKSLNGNNIPYMISGSIAMNIYTIPRLTRDIDIVIELDKSGIDDFIGLFPDSYFNIDTIRDETVKRGMFNIIDNQTGFKIDFIIRKDTRYFKLAFDRRQKIHEFDTDLWIITLEDLIIAKLVWIQEIQSDQHKSDIHNLLLYPDIDMSYINKWCQELNLETFNLLQNE